MFAIVMDTTSSIDVEDLQEQGVTIIPLTVEFGEESFVDGLEMSPAQFYAKMEDYKDQGLPKTVCPSPEVFRKTYVEAMETGADSILVITLSSGLSSTSGAAYLAAREFDAPVTVFDSKSGVQVMSLMVEKAIKMRDAGATVAEAVEALEKIRDANLTLFCLDTMENLVKGGRVGKAAGLAGEALKIKPLLTLNKEEGIVEEVSRARGVKSMLRSAADKVEEYVNEHGDCAVRLSHANSPERLNALKEEIESRGIKVDEQEGWIGCVFGTHVGPSCVSVTVCPRDLL